MSQQLTQDQLIILRKFPINESDMLIVAFGKKLGKILIKAKGEKKIKSQFKGKINVFNLLKTTIYDSGRSFTLTEANLIHPGPDGSNLESFQISQQISKILNQILPDQHPNNQLFQLITNIIQTQQSQINQSNLFEIFILKLLFIEGYITPVIPPEKIPEGKELYFYIDTNGSINSTLDPKVDSPNLIHPKLVKAINFFIKNPLSTCCKLKLNQEEKEALQLATKHLFQNNFQTELRIATQII
jgi:DNA repair protein RecO